MLLIVSVSNDVETVEYSHVAPATSQGLTDEARTWLGGKYSRLYCRETGLGEDEAASLAVQIQVLRP